MQNRSCFGHGYQWEAEDIREGGWRVDMVEIFCTHVCKWKMRPVETIPGMEGRGIKENDDGGELNYEKFQELL
jgi:hypothetical protein